MSPWQEGNPMNDRMREPPGRIARVRRADHVVSDRHRLGCPDFHVRLHCECCARANGLLVYASAVAVRTGQTICPIKHARKALGAHAGYGWFLDCGAAADHHGRLEQVRKSLG
jgi:hypothetical protein